MKYKKNITFIFLQIELTEHLKKCQNFVEDNFYGQIIFLIM